MLQTPTGSWRTAYRGEFGAWGCATRFVTNERFKPPFVLTGRINVRRRKWPYVTEWGTEISYDPGVVIHPMHDIAGTADDGNEENVIVRFSSLNQQNVSVSAELPAPLNYGVRTGYESRVVSPSPFLDGTSWHRVRVEVDSPRVYAVWLDDQLLAHVVEKEPATMHGPDFEIGFRLDFLDAELADLRVERL